MNPRRVLIQLVGWPLTGLLVWWWLSLPEEKIRQLALSALLALVIVALTAALVAHAFGCLRHAHRVAPWLIGAGAAAGFILWRGYNPWWAVVPWLAALPGFHWAANGPGYFGLWRRPRTYLGIAFWALAALLLPWLLIRWVPDVGPSFGAQATSAAIRFGLAALLFILSWNALGAWWMRDKEESRAES